MFLDDKQNELNAALNDCLNAIKNQNVSPEIFNRLFKKLSDFVTSFEENLVTSYKNPKEVSDLKIQDDVTSIKNLFDLTLKIYEVFQESKKLTNRTFAPQKCFLETSQWILKSYAMRIENHGILIEAVGGLALFIVLFFANPAKPPEYKPESELNKTVNSADKNV